MEERERREKEKDDEEEAKKREEEAVALAEAQQRLAGRWAFTDGDPKAMALKAQERARGFAYMTAHEHEGEHFQQADGQADRANKKAEKRKTAQAQGGGAKWNCLDNKRRDADEEAQETTQASGPGPQRAKKRGTKDTKEAAAAAPAPAVAVAETARQRRRREKAEVEERELHELHQRVSERKQMCAEERWMIEIMVREARLRTQRGQEREAARRREEERAETRLANGEIMREYMAFVTKKKMRERLEQERRALARAEEYRERRRMRKEDEHGRRVVAMEKLSAIAVGKLY
jgi:hypothetical protein